MKLHGLIKLFCRKKIQGVFQRFLHIGQLYISPAVVSDYGAQQISKHIFRKNGKLQFGLQIPF